MLAHTVANRVELSFWNVVIYLLSNSRLTQKLYRYLYEQKRAYPNLAWVPMTVVAFAGIGLVAGFVAGRMGVSLW
jgi:hypothetical protein